MDDFGLYWYRLHGLRPLELVTRLVAFELTRSEGYMEFIYGEYRGVILTTRRQALYWQLLRNPFAGEIIPSPEDSYALSDKLIVPFRLTDTPLC